MFSRHFHNGRDVWSSRAIVGLHLALIENGGRTTNYWNIPQLKTGTKTTTQHVFKDIEGFLFGLL